MCCLVTAIDRIIDCCIGSVCVSLEVRDASSLFRLWMVSSTQNSIDWSLWKTTHTHTQTHVHKEIQSCASKLFGWSLGLVYGSVYLYIILSLCVSWLFFSSSSHPSLNISCLLLLCDLLLQASQTRRNPGVSSQDAGRPPSALLPGATGPDQTR